MHKKLEKILQWANEKDNIRALLLTGSLAGNGYKDELSDYDIAVYGYDFDFINNDQWLNTIHHYWVCIHDEFKFLDFNILTRLTIFDAAFKVDFSFHPLELLTKLINSKTLPDEYNIGYHILLDKDGLAAKLPQPTYKGFIIQQPNEQDFQKNMNEFWFEVYHVAKYIYRNDLWTAKLRDSAAKEWLRQMLQWQQASKQNWNFSPKNYGKGMKNWLDKTLWNDLQFCFGKFDPKDSSQALANTVKLYRKTAIATAKDLRYDYNYKLDESISEFIEKLK